VIDLVGRLGLHDHLSLEDGVVAGRIRGTVRYTGPFAPPSAPFVTDAATAALYHLDEGAGNVVGDSSGAAGGPSNGVRMFGGNPPGPEWVVSTAPLPVELLSFAVE
jgi:hypothetical protein